MVFTCDFNAKSASGAGISWADCYRFNSMDTALTDKSQHRLNVIRRAVTQPHSDALPAAFRLRYHAPELCRVEFVMRHKGRVKAPQAGKPAHQRDLRDGQQGVGQQLFGGMEPAGLQVLQR